MGLLDTWKENRAKKEIDKDFIKYTLGEVGKQPNKPFSMHNAEYADTVFLHIQKKYPGAVMVKIEGGGQHIAVTEKGRAALVKQCQTRIEKHKQEISRWEMAIDSLTHDLACINLKEQNEGFYQQHGLSDPNIREMKYTEIQQKMAGEYEDKPRPRHIEVDEFHTLFDRKKPCDENNDSGVQ